MKTTSTTIIRKVETYCRTCNQEIRFDKNHRTATCKWILLNIDLSYHDCPAKQKRQQQPLQQPTTVMTSELLKEIAAIKAQLLVLVSRLDRIEQQEMMQH